MVQLNKIGETFGKLPYITAMTDVTGFGLLGHLSEVCEGAGISAEIQFDRIPLIDRKALLEYVAQKSVPGGTQRNFDSYGHKIGPLTPEQKALLCDPQTSGGLLVAVESGYEDTFEMLTRGQGFSLQSFGRLVPRRDVLITVS